MSFIVILQRSYCYHKKTCSAIYIDVSNVSRLQNSTRYGSRFIFSVPFAQICHRKTKVRRTSNDDLHTVMDKSQTYPPILYCKIPIWRVGVWPICVGPAHSTLGQPTLYTSSLTYSKMSIFWWVVLKWRAVTFSQLIKQYNISEFFFYFDLVPKKNILLRSSQSCFSLHGRNRNQTFEQWYQTLWGQLAYK